MDSCPGIDSLCAFIPIEGCCLTNEECGDGDPCTQDTCTSSQGGECLNIWVCCDTDADCDDGEDVCTDDVCVDNYCQFLFTGASGCCIPVMYENDFEGNLDGWTINNSSDTYGWKLSTAKSVSGSQSLAYTDAGGTSYGSSNNGSCLSPTVELPDQPGLTLSFMLWYKIESCCDNFDLSVVHDGGTTLMANYASTIVTGWQEVTFDATAYQGQTVQLLLEFSCDGSVSYEGVFIDDLMVIQEDCCSEDVDCDDGAICTMDSCPWINSLCLFEPIPGCCSTFAECDDGDPCTEDSCPMNGEGCQNIDICCQSDADCDDGDDVCTNDTCVDEYCQFLFTGAPGCCQPLLWEDAFENGKGGWVFQNSSASPSWHLSTVKSSDGGTALAFSDAAGFSTGNDQDSTATSPTIEVGAQPGIALTFQVWYDTESGFDWCKVWVDHDGGSAQLDQFTGHNEIFWQEKTYSLEEWAGQAVNIRFEWHCDVSASYPGIWIDEMTITQGCCNTDVDCEDDNPCTVDDCPGLESMCSNTWMALCCLEDGDCNDMDECTVDLCVEMVCEYEPTGADGC